MNLVNSVKGQSIEFIALGQSYKSLSEAYKDGQSRATGEIICYIHQDIIIHNVDFESKLHYFFRDHKDCGFVGIIGNNKPAPDKWWIPEENRRGYIRQTDHTGKIKPTIFNFGRGTQRSAQMDGCLLMTNRKDWEFPDLPGIHFLDLWMCNLALERGFENWIIDLDIEHTSWGETDSIHYKNNQQIYLDKWQKKLLTL